jgi:hypothetical protein
LRNCIAAAVLVTLSQPGDAQLIGNRTSVGCINVAEARPKATVKGRLTKGTFKDEYGTERAFILQLPRAACIDDGGQFADPDETFTQVQVSATNSRLFALLQKSVGRRVTVRGNGFAAHTRHHRRPLVVIADEVTVR